MKMEELEQWCNRTNDDGKGNFTLVPKGPVMIVWEGDYDDNPYVIKDIAFFDATEEVTEDGGPAVGISRVGYLDDSVAFDISYLPNLKFNIYIKAN